MIEQARLGEGGQVGPGGDQRGVRGRRRPASSAPLNIFPPAPPPGRDFPLLSLEHLLLSARLSTTFACPCSRRLTRPPTPYTASPCTFSPSYSRFLRLPRWLVLSCSPASSLVRLPLPPHTTASCLARQPLMLTADRCRLSPSDSRRRQHGSFQPTTSEQPDLFWLARKRRRPPTASPAAA